MDQEQDQDHEQEVARQSLLTTYLLTTHFLTLECYTGEL
jgi:hypothetical protein